MMNLHCHVETGCSNVQLSGVKISRLISHTNPKTADNIFHHLSFHTISHILEKHLPICFIPLVFLVNIRAQGSVVVVNGGLHDHQLGVQDIEIICAV